MTIKEKYDLAEWAMQTALDNGAREVVVSIFSSVSSSVEVRDNKIDKLEQENQSGLSIKLFVDNKYSVHSTNRLNNKDELARFISEAIEGTRYLSEDEYRTLPDPALYYKGDGKDLKTYDSEIETIDPRSKIDTAFAIEKEIIGTDDKIISVTASYSDGMSNSVMLTSNGFKGDSSGSYFGVYASVSVDGGDARPQSGWSESTIFHSKLNSEGLAKTALLRAKRKIGQKKIASGKMKMIVENRLAGQLLSPVISALNGSAIQQKNSFLVDSKGKKFGSDKLSLTDDPTLISGRGSKHFDNEGLALTKRKVFEKGVLKSYFIDTYYGKKLGMEPTSGSISNLVFETGTRTPEELISTIDRGILVTGFNGGNTNGATGDFSYGIEGFLIEKGKEIQPVSEMNITGNMKDLWMNLEETGNDAYENSSWRTPTLVFRDVDFSGL
ncbi:MAG: TldD/PmbA family protein [Marinilabiliaceae bacterium]|jgi:PmbA protein|nr:TldD/PmbA family protein [Marinilabiliaceae bacterium]